MADVRIFKEAIQDEEIFEDDGTPFYLTQEATECLERWVFLEIADDAEITQFLKNIASSLNLKLIKSEGKSGAINSHIVRVKIDIGTKAVSLQADVQYTGTTWTTFIDEVMTNKEARTLSNYMRIARAGVDKKYHHLGIHRILSILAVIEKKEINFNDFMEKELSSGGFEVIMEDDDELARHLKKRLNYYQAIKKLDGKKISLTQAEDVALKSATDNNYKPTSNDISHIATLKNNNLNVAEFFEDKKLPLLPAKIANGLNTDTELANFREELTRVVALLEGLDSKDILSVEKELREDLVLSLGKALMLLEPQEDEQASSSKQEEE